MTKPKTGKTQVITFFALVLKIPKLSLNTKLSKDCGLRKFKKKQLGENDKEKSKKRDRPRQEVSFKI